MTGQDKVTTYGVKESLLDVLKSSFSNLIEGFGLGKQLAIRDVRGMYRQSFLGMLWAVFIPVAQTLIWVFLSKGGILTVGDTGVPYPLFVLSGIMLWQTFIDSVTSPLTMFNSARSILSKININKESLIIAGMLKVLFNLGIRILIIIPVLLMYQVTFVSSMLLAPLAILVVVVFGHVIGILVTPLGVLYQDVLRFIQSFAQLFFFLTPIIYPARTSGFFATVDRFNPAAISICTARDLLIGQGMSDPGLYVYFVGGVVVIGVIGMALYRISLPIIIERMGS